MKADLPSVVMRMLEERAELSAKLARAITFVSSETFKHLPTDEQTVFNEQVFHMDRYLDALDHRVEMIRKRIGA